MNKHTVQVIVGTQYGSEGKGATTGYTIQGLIEAGGIDKNNTIISVRVGGPNAGHCVVDPMTGHKYAFRTVPVGAAIDSRINNYIASGSEIDLDVLENEIHELLANNRAPHLVISGQATWLEPDHIKMEKNSDLNARTGSTAKGIGAARAARIWRTAKTIEQAIQTEPSVNNRWHLLKDKLTHAGGSLMIDTNGTLLSELLTDRTPNALRAHIVIEGTQGYGLGLHAGLYPQCTSNDARAIDFLAMAGVNPWTPGVRLNVLGVARTNPIRVAGNSGPLQGETTWEELGQESERTTVTQKTRRVGTWDPALVEAAVKHGGVTHLVITMLDKQYPAVANLRGEHGGLVYVNAKELTEASPEAAQFITDTELYTGAPVFMIGIGPDCYALLTP